MANITNNQVRTIKIAKDFGFQLTITLPSALTGTIVPASDNAVLRLRCKDIDLPDFIYNQIQYTVAGHTMNDIGNEANSQQKTITFYEDIDSTISDLFTKWGNMNQDRLTGNSFNKTELSAKIKVEPTDRSGSPYYQYNYFGVLGLNFVNGKLGNGEGGGKARESVFTFSYDDHGSGKPTDTITAG